VTGDVAEISQRQAKINLPSMLTEIPLKQEM
jgi:hypothetical protein